MDGRSKMRQAEKKTALKILKERTAQFLAKDGFRTITSESKIGMEVEVLDLTNYDVLTSSQAGKATGRCNRHVVDRKVREGSAKPAPFT